MSRSSTAGLIAGVSLFLEACAFYLLIAIIAITVSYRDIALPFWLVLLSLAWAYLLSFYLETLNFSLNLRGVLGVIVAVFSLLLFGHWNTGLGVIPLDTILHGDARAIAGIFLTLASLLLLWWRGATMAQEEVVLDTVDGSFRWGLIMLVAATLVDVVAPGRIISGFLAMGFFGMGLTGLALARFSYETSTRSMSLDWLVPIGISVGAVLILGLTINLLGLGGLDDVTRGIGDVVLTVGLWVLAPVLLAVGYVILVLVKLLQWLVGIFGGGELPDLNQAQSGIEQLRDDLSRESGETGTPAALVAFLKTIAFLTAASVTAWLLFRLFRIRRRFKEKGEVEETRESFFSWIRAKQDLRQLLGQWWRQQRTDEEAKTLNATPRTPREIYHSLLAVALEMGRPRRHWQAPREHQKLLEPLLPLGPVGRIVDDFQDTYYGSQELGEAEMEQLQAEWASIQELRSGADSLRPPPTP